MLVRLVTRLVAKLAANLLVIPRLLSHMNLVWIAFAQRAFNLMLVTVLANELFEAHLVSGFRTGLAVQ